MGFPGDTLRDSAASSTPAHESPVIWRSPLVLAAICLVLGLVLGRLAPHMTPWLITALIAAGGAGALAFFRRRPTPLLLISAVAASAAWWTLRTGQFDSFGLAAAHESQLVMLEGVVDGDVRHRIRSRGSLGRFDYRAPSTSFILRVDTVHADGQRRPARAGVLVTIIEFDGRLRHGDRVRCGGWLSRFAPPANPGDKAFGDYMAERGVVGRVTVKSRGNCEILAPAVGITDQLSRWREAVMRRAQIALREGVNLPADSPTLALLRTLLLGEGREDLRDLEAAFQQTGLTHLLSISGLHLAILVAGGWWLALRLTGRPRAALWSALALMAVYVAVLPPQVPLTRSAVMTAAACWALASGRRVSALVALAAAAIGLLIWRPVDLFSAGFQLSFAVVAALVLFTPRLAEALRGQTLGPVTWRTALRHRFTDALAVTLVAFTASAPLVIHHFQLISPAAMLVSLIMLPVGALLLYAGYLKLLMSLLLPPLGAAMGPLVTLIAQGTESLVRFTAAAPGAAWWMPATSPLWAFAAMLLAAGLLAGKLHRRPVPLALCFALCTTWLFWPVAAQRLERRDEALRVDMFSVGDGSCYLLRSGAANLIFDCGSANYYDIATASIAPSLRAMGVLTIDALVVTHPDTDHFSGVLELVDQLRIRRVITTDTFLRREAERPYSAPAFLLQQLRARGVTIDAIHSGWTHTLGEARIEAIWPPEPESSRRFARDNDTSIVLSVRAAGRRLLLTGDIQLDAMTAMLKLGMDLRADVLELPHHGSMTPIAPAWVKSVNPAVMLQSTGHRRLRDDRWAQAFGDVQRHITARHGMTSVLIGRDGQLSARRFLSMEPPDSGDLE